MFAVRAVAFVCLCVARCALPFDFVMAVCLACCVLFGRVLLLIVIGYLRGSLLLVVRCCSFVVWCAVVSCVACCVLCFVACELFVVCC